MPAEEVDGIILGLRSPSGEALTRDGDRLISADGASYPVVDGVPILIDDDRSIFSVAEVIGHGHVERRRSLVSSIVGTVVPSHTLAIGSADRYRQFAEHVGDGRVLIVGGGTLGQGAEALVESRARLVQTDVFRSDRIDVVCDAHDLPFADGTFDGVVFQAVLEHVLDPVRVVAEAWRVLAAGGVIYAETPFLQAVHEGAYDFTRWTELGHRRLFRMFEEIDRGVVAGPATTLVWAIRYFARSIPKRGGRTSLLFDKLATLMFFWLKYFDRRLITHPGASDGASGVYFLGRRSAQPVADQVIIEGYRGTFGAPTRSASS